MPPKKAIQALGKYARPVRITTFGPPSVPLADFFVTGWHALLIDNTLAPAGNLINGNTITLYAGAGH